MLPSQRLALPSPPSPFHCFLPAMETPGAAPSGRVSGQHCWACWYKAAQYSSLRRRQWVEGKLNYQWVREKGRKKKGHTWVRNMYTYKYIYIYICIVQRGFGKEEVKNMQRLMKKDHPVVNAQDWDSFTLLHLNLPLKLTLYLCTLKGCASTIRSLDRSFRYGETGWISRVWISSCVRWIAAM